MKNDKVLAGRDDFYWGVCTHTSRYSAGYCEENMEEYIHYAAEMGAKILRHNSNGPEEEVNNFVRLCNAYGMKVMLVVYAPGMAVDAKGNLEEIEEEFYNTALRFDGKHGNGRVDFIQLHNEVDLMVLHEIYGKNGIPTPDGDRPEEWNEEYLACIAEQFKAAHNGVKRADPTIKTVINHCWKHSGMLDYLYGHGVEWDIVGHDWYGDMMHALEDRDGTTAYGIGKTLFEKYGKPIMLCESNNFDLANIPWDDTSLEPYDVLVRCMEDVYSKPYVIGHIMYELVDEMCAFERKDWKLGDKTWNQEGHFGMLSTDWNGKNLAPKPIYYRLKKIMGGKDLPVITVEGLK